MNINRINNTNNTFSGWIPSGKNSVWLYMMHNGTNTSGVQKLLENIEKNSKRYFIDFDAYGNNFMLKAFTNKFKPSENCKVIMPGTIFNRSLKSCLKKMNRFLIKENKINGENRFVTALKKTFSEMKESLKQLKEGLLWRDERLTTRPPFSKQMVQMDVTPSICTHSVSDKTLEPIAGPVPPMPASILPGRSPKAITPEDLLKSQ